jgi:hypothetical protein
VVVTSVGCTDLATAAGHRRTRPCPASGVGATSLPGGLSQITWNGHPLYLFSNEALALTPNGGAAPVGNGNGIKAFGGTFSLVVNP